MASENSTLQYSKTIWYRWSFHVAVLTSLFLQIFLFFMAPLRRRTQRIIIIWPIFGAYLMADWLAAFAVGLISNAQDNDKYRTNKNVALFWAAFLLLHLGGPDSITAFSLEDNDLWRRHLFGLLARLAVVCYVFFQSLPHVLWRPTVLVLIAGTIKYGERTRALYLACLANSKKSMLPKDYNELSLARKIATGETHRARSRSVKVEAASITTTEFELVERAYRFYKTFSRVLILDLKILQTEELDKSEQYFLETTAREAFRVMEVELNFMYDSLYTKMAVVHCRQGYLLRLLCLLLIVVSFALFANEISAVRHNWGIKLQRRNAVVTYTLLVGTVGLELAMAVQFIFSDWIVTLLETPNQNKNKIVSLFRRISRPRLRRWSNSMSQHSFINYCSQGRFQWFDKVADFFGLGDFLDNQQYITTCGVKDNLKEFIFEELKQKKKEANSDPKIAKEICSARGEWALKKSFPESSPTCDSILKAIPSQDSDYIDCLLRWHVATELCYFTSDEKNTTHNKPRQVDDLNPNDHRGFCKVLSQYMLYLLVMRPTMIPEGDGVGRMRFLHYCTEARKFFRNTFFHSERSRRWWELKLNQKEELKKASETLLRKIVTENEGSSFPFLKDACRLASELEKLKDNKWKVMSKVWAELLAYAAIHHKVNTAHAQQLNRGGELITFVWLLTAHFGFLEPAFWTFDYDSDDRRAVEEQPPPV